MVALAATSTRSQISGATNSTTGATCSGGGSADGDCRNSVSFLLNNGTTLKSRYAWNINANTGVFSTHDTSGTAQHNIAFTATAPGGYQLDIATNRMGDLNRISDVLNCEGSADTSSITGTSDLALSSGTLSLADPGDISNGGSTTESFNQNRAATIFPGEGGTHMRRILLGLVVSALLVGLRPSPATAQADHLQCFKIKDTAAKASYTADLTPADTGLPVAAGCVVRVPARLLCVDVVKSIVGTPIPPGAPAGDPTHKFLCYKVKCPKAAPTASVVDQFGTHQVIVKSTSILCAPVPVPTTTTTSTTTTTTMCAAGFADCDNNSVNGCEANLASDPNNCGGCGTACPSAPNAAPGCTAGQCMFTCNAGYADCDTQAPNGCEVSLASDPNNCGGCGTACLSAPNAPPTCTASLCTFTCAAGYADCDNMQVNGCEVNTTSDPNNCGACGNVCPVGNSCVSSACVP